MLNPVFIMLGQGIVCLNDNLLKGVVEFSQRSRLLLVLQ